MGAGVPGWSDHPAWLPPALQGSGGGVREGAGVPSILAVTAQGHLGHPAELGCRTQRPVRGYPGQRRRSLARGPGRGLGTDCMLFPNTVIGPGKPAPANGYLKWEPTFSKRALD